MRTNLKVASKNKGTLKMKKENILRSAFAAVIMSLVSLVGMSFTTDTTRSSDSVVKNALTAVTATNDAGELLISPVNNLSILRADMVMDANFRTNEARNRKMAVAFTKMIAAEANAVDEQMSENLNRNYMISLFNQSLSGDVQAADVKLDAMMNDEAETKAKAIAFRNSINLQLTEADESMDVMVNMSALPTVKPEIAKDADKVMDALFLNLKKITPAASKEADVKMDELISNQ